MYHSQSRPSPHSICPWVTWLLICCIDLISKVLFKCSITPASRDLSVASVWSLAESLMFRLWLAKHLAREAGRCRLVIRALKSRRVTYFFCLVFSFVFFFNSLEKLKYTRHQVGRKFFKRSCCYMLASLLKVGQLEIRIDGDCIRSEILMSDHSCFNGSIKVKERS